MDERIMAGLLNPKGFKYSKQTQVLTFEPSEKGKTGRGILENVSF